MIKPAVPHIKKNMVVVISYRLTRPPNQVLELRKADDPLAYIHGYDTLLRAVELVLEGQIVGFRTSLQLTPEQAYGPYRDDLVSLIPIDEFDPDVDLKPGMKFQTEGPDGEEMSVRIMNIQGEHVTVDGNHPLAGIELLFEIEVLEVREASSEELEIVKELDKSHLH